MWIYRMSDAGSRWLIYLGGSALFMIMVLTGLDVLLRYFFNQPIQGSYEITEYLMVILIAFGMPYCASKKGHVTVDIFILVFSETVRGIINCISTFVSLVLCCLITWQSALYMKKTIESGWGSPMLYIPVYPFIAVLTAGFAMFSIVLLVDFIAFCLKEVQK